MAPPVADQAARPPAVSVVAALRFAGAASIEWLHVVAAWNVAVVVLTVIVLLPLAGTPMALGVVPLLVWLANPLLRVAALARRDRVVTLRSGLAGLTRRSATKAAVAAVIGAVIVLAVVNLALLPGFGDVAAGMVAMATVIVVAAAVGVGVVTMTLLNDPEHEARPTASILRLAVAVGFRHPATWLILLLAGTLLARVAAELVWPFLLLPGVAALVVAGAVVPATDHLTSVPDAGPGQPSGSARTKTRGRPARSSRTG